MSESYTVFCRNDGDYVKISDYEKLQQQIEDMKKYELFFVNCSCLFAEGVEFMTKVEIYEKIKQEVKKLEGLTRKEREI